jgi:serine/threonine-protein kinase
LRDPPDPIRELRPEVPDGIQTILAKCLQKEREKRYENVGQLALALAEFGPERVRNSAQRVWRTVQAAGLPAKSGDAALLPPADRTTGSHPTRVVWDQSSNGLRPKRGPLRWVALTGLVGCALAGALAWRISVRGGPDADAGQVAAPGQVAEPSSVAAPSASQVAVEELPAAPPPSSSAIVAKPIEARHSIELSGAAHPPMKTPLVIKRAPRVNTASTVSPRSKSANVFDDRN